MSLACRTNSAALNPAGQRPVVAATECAPAPPGSAASVGGPELPAPAYCSGCSAQSCRACRARAANATTATMRPINSRPASSPAEAVVQEQRGKTGAEGEPGQRTEPLRRASRLLRRRGGRSLLLLLRRFGRGLLLGGRAALHAEIAAAAEAPRVGVHRDQRQPDETDDGSEMVS